MLSYRNDVVSGLFEQAEHVCLPDSALRSVTASRLRDWWWREAESGLPRKQRFDVLEHFDAAPDLFLVEVLPDDEFRTRLIGENAKAHVEAGRLGAILRWNDPQAFRQVLWRYYHRVVIERRPMMCMGDVHYAATKSRLYEGLDCPLSTDGTQVTHILGILTVF